MLEEAHNILLHDKLPILAKLYIYLSIHLSIYLIPHPPTTDRMFLTSSLSVFLLSE
jgi:hypothetical protein